MRYVPPRRFGLALLALLVVTQAACDSGDPNGGRVGISGHWAGTLTNLNDPSQVYAIDLTLVDTISNVTGSGFVDLPGERITFTGIGLFSGSLLNLTVTYNRPPPGSLSCNVSAARDAMTGTMSGPGLVNGNVDMMLSLQKMP